MNCRVAPRRTTHFNGDEPHGALPLSTVHERELCRSGFCARSSLADPPTGRGEREGLCRCGRWRLWAPGEQAQSLPGCAGGYTGSPCEEHRGPFNGSFLTRIITKRRGYCSLGNRAHMDNCKTTSSLPPSLFW